MSLIISRAPGNTTPVFVIDNVLEFIASKPTPIRVDALPCVVPPFPKIWMEGLNPIPLEAPDWKRMGAFVLHIPLSRAPENVRLAAEGESYTGDLITVIPTVEKRDGTLPEPKSYICFLLKSDGSPDGRVIVIGDAQDDLETATSLRDVCSTYLVALSFINCKNVVQKTHTTPPRKLKRKHAGRKHGTPPPPPVITYRVLEIDPMRTALRGAGHVPGQPGTLERALHLCRGHFRTYTPEHPAFGKHVGTFFVPAHVRGTSRAGIVLKDYAVKAP